MMIRLGTQHERRDLKAKLKHIAADVLQLLRLGSRVHRSHDPNVDILGFSDTLATCEE